MDMHFELIGGGLYSIPEAARLTKVPAVTINRWVRGYARRRQGEKVEYPAIMPSSLDPIDGRFALNFRDLMEVRFVGKLRDLKISWSEIRNTVLTARDICESDYPFGSLTFKTDGRKVFARLQQTNGINLLRQRQFIFEEIFEPSLFAELEYEGGRAVRWRPSSGLRVVVLDPGRSFGQPLLDEYDVRTSVVATSVEAEGSEERVADWYDIPLQAVHAAVSYERYLMA
jgi:uncharacterized protein (DUF433 family)